MSAPLRIAMVGTRGMPTTYGGVERAVEELSVRLVELGHEVIVYCRKGYTSTQLDAYRGVTLLHLPTINSKHLEAFVHSALATLDVVRRDVDIVHFHATGPALFIPIARLGRVRVVATVQGLDHLRAKWGRGARIVLRLGAWCAARLPDRTIVVSHELRRHFRTKYGTDAVYIPNGVSPVATTSTPPFGVLRRGYVLFLGRLVPEKGLEHLIRAYGSVVTELPLLIAGPDSHSEAYVDELRRLAADDPRIRFVGPVYGDAKNALVKNARLFCQPSLVEGLPIALLEAASAGTNVLVSALPEHLEIVGNAARTFPPADVDALASALRAALSDGDADPSSGESLQRRVRAEYDWDRVAAAVDGLYADLLGEPRVRGRDQPTAAGAP